MEKEYARLESERLGEEPGTEKTIADMATRIDELEAKLDASNERLEKKIDASHSRLEAMFAQILASKAPTSCTPPVSPRDNDGVPVSVMLPILADGARNTAKEKQVVSLELTMKVRPGVAKSVHIEGHAEEAAKEKEPDTTPTPVVDTATPGAAPSAIVVPSPKPTPKVGARASQLVAGSGCTSPRTHLEEMLASTVLDTAATEAVPSSAVALEQPVQVLRT